MTWGPVKHFEGVLEVNIIGQIREVKTGELVKLTPIILSAKARLIPANRRVQQGKLLLNRKANDGKQRTVYPHIECARNFCANPENKPTVDHIDGNYTNNEWWNLRWATMSEQQRFRIFLTQIKGFEYLA